METMIRTAASLVAPGRGILVADEYVDTMIRQLGIAPEGVAGPEYVDQVIAPAGVEPWIAAVLLTARTFAASTTMRGPDPALPFQVGVRMDTHRTARAAGSRDGVAEARRLLTAHRAAGATFVEWRANLDPLTIPSGTAHIDAVALARGAAASQAEGVMPLLTVAMPELDPHRIEVTEAVTGNAIAELFAQLRKADVDTKALLLRVNMVQASRRSLPQSSPEAVAQATLKVLTEVVPADVPGIVFLSGGQRLERACAGLSAITALGHSQGLQWRFGFAFTRALLAGSLANWRGDIPAVEAQSELRRSCRRAGQAVSPVSAIPA